MEGEEPSELISGEALPDEISDMLFFNTADKNSAKNILQRILEPDLDQK
jgi:hypothetical protein